MNKMMKKALMGAIAFIVSIPLGLMAQDEGFYPYSYARLSYVNGSVYVQRTADLGYEKGEINLALVQGDKMGTENGQAEVHFGHRNYLRLSDNTRVEFAVLPQEGDERIKIHLTEGSAYLRVSRLAVDKGIEVHTPDASYYVLEEGLYRFDVRLDRETEVFVHEGSLEAAASDGSVLVRAKESVTASDGRLAGDPEYSYSREDAFDDWNGSRDAEISQRSERQYLPSDIEEYEEELDQNGHWVYERPYGNVWVPNVSYSDWRPYLYGRWVWYPVIGWNWVSSESWGWPVYHYGRWHWRFGLGWYWIPRHHWGPAWVHWWWDNDHIGWCPLSWYNRPVVIVNNHFYDRHHDPYVPAHNRALTVIRRNHLQSPDIARRQLGANELARIDKVALKSEQPRLRPAVDNARPQALEAKRALAARPGSRNQVKSLPPAESMSPGRLRQGAASQGARTRERGSSLSGPNRNSVSRPAIKNPDADSRAIRSFPSQRASGTRKASGAAEDRRSVMAAPSRRDSPETRGGTPARISPSQNRAPASSKTESRRDTQKAGKTEDASKKSAVRKDETIKNYQSSARSESSARSSRTFSSSPRRASGTSTYSSRSSVSQPSSRLSVRASSASRSSSSTLRSSSSARSGSPSYSRSYSRPSSSLSPSYSKPRSSYSAPSRSSGSSGRSIGSPRPSGSSSGRSYSAPRASGSSSSGRSASSGGSSSSSSKSSGSSSKSGSVKRKG